MFYILKSCFTIVTMCVFASAYLQINAYQPANVVLKSGETYVDIQSKLKNNSLKHKVDENSKAVRVVFSELVSVELGCENDRRLVEFFMVKDHNTYVAVQKVMEGGNLEVYGIERTQGHNIPGGGTYTDFYIY